MNSCRTTLDPVGRQQTCMSMPSKPPSIGTHFRCSLGVISSAVRSSVTPVRNLLICQRSISQAKPFSNPYLNPFSRCVLVQQDLGRKACQAGERGEFRATNARTFHIFDKITLSRARKRTRDHNRGAQSTHQALHYFKLSNSTVWVDDYLRQFLRGGCNRMQHVALSSRADVISRMNHN